MAFCTGCGAALAAGARFCATCGVAAPVGIALGSGTMATAPPAAAGPSAASAEAGGTPLPPLAAAAAAFAASGALSFLAWGILALPVRVPTFFIGNMVPYGCPYETQSAAMYVCSAKIALVRLIGPILITVLVIVFRNRLRELVRAIAPKLPVKWQFLVAPLVATVAFTLAWAGSHYEVAASRGIVTQRVFPAFIGLFTYAAATWGPALQQRYKGFFDRRDRYPVWLRIVVALLVPFIISMAITYEDRVTQPVLKEQIVVLLSIVAGYVALAPRSGQLGKMLER